MSRSADWIRRQSRDPYYHLAKKQGYNSRAAFKLEQIDQKYNLISKGIVAVDLGSSPGGWAQVLLRRGASLVVGVDLLAPPQNVCSETRYKWIQGDMLAEETKSEVLNLVAGKKVDLVVSDMLGNSTGDDRVDHFRSIHLAHQALEFALKVLDPAHSSFVCKVLQGADGELSHFHCAFTLV